MEIIEKSANTNGESHDWRDDCIRPPKDNRVQTAVRLHEFFYYKYGNKLKFPLLQGCDSNQRFSTCSA